MSIGAWTGTKGAEALIIASVLQKVSVPFGVVGSIYEARPNVTVDIAALALCYGRLVLPHL